MILSLEKFLYSQVACKYNYKTILYMHETHLVSVLSWKN